MGNAHHQGHLTVIVETKEPKPEDGVPDICTIWARKHLFA